MRMLVAAVVLALGACGPGVEMTAAPGDAAPMSGPDGGGVDTAAAPDTQPSPSPDTRAPDTRAPDTAPNFPECMSAPGFTAGACGYIVTGHCGGYGWVPKFKDGMQCGTCGLNGSARTGCKVTDRGPDECGDPRPPILCVENCGECCWGTVGAPCDQAADCCAPLTCQSGSGTSKSCR